MVRSSKKTRYIPPDYTIRTHPDLPGTVVYISPDKIYALAYVGRAVNLKWNYRFRDAKHLETYISDFFESLLKKEKEKAKSKPGKDFRHSLKIGDILSYSWGYDQTNVDFFQVVKTTEKSVSIRQIASTVEQRGFMSGDAKPIKDRFVGPIQTKRVKPNNLLNATHGIMKPYDGKPKYVSWGG